MGKRGDVLKNKSYNVFNEDNRRRVAEDEARHLEQLTREQRRDGDTAAEQRYEALLRGVDTHGAFSTQASGTATQPHHTATLSDTAGYSWNKSRDDTQRKRRRNETTEEEHLARRNAVASLGTTVQTLPKGCNITNAASYFTAQPSSSSAKPKPKPKPVEPSLLPSRLTTKEAKLSLGCTQKGVERDYLKRPAVQKLGEGFADDGAGKEMAELQSILDNTSEPRIQTRKQPANGVLDKMEQAAKAPLTERTSRKGGQVSVVQVGEMDLAHAFGGRDIARGEATPWWAKEQKERTKPEEQKVEKKEKKEKKKKDKREKVSKEDKYAALRREREQREAVEKQRAEALLN